MSEETRLTEHEKQHLNALKLFLERTSDLKVLESGKVIDALSPEGTRGTGSLQPCPEKSTRRDSGAHNLSAWLSIKTSTRCL